MWVLGSRRISFQPASTERKPPRERAASPVVTAGRKPRYPSYRWEEPEYRNPVSTSSRRDRSSPSRGAPHLQHPQGKRL